MFSCAFLTWLYHIMLLNDQIGLLHMHVMHQSFKSEGMVHTYSLPANELSACDSLNSKALYYENMHDI